MGWGRIAGLTLLMLGLAAASVAAEKPTLADASLQGGETVLMTAARAGNLEAVKALLARGANPNARERLDQTALMWAAAEGHAAVVRALIDGGADIRASLN